MTQPLSLLHPVGPGMDRPAITAWAARALPGLAVAPADIAADAQAGPRDLVLHAGLAGAVAATLAQGQPPEQAADDWAAALRPHLGAAVIIAAAPGPEPALLAPLLAPLGAAMMLPALPDGTAPGPLDRLMAAALLACDPDLAALHAALSAGPGRWAPALPVPDAATLLAAGTGLAALCHDLAQARAALLPQQDWARALRDSLWAEAARAAAAEAQARSAATALHDRTAAEAARLRLASVTEETLRADLAARARRIADLEGSTSWRITAPLRAIVLRLRRLRGRG